MPASSPASQKPVTKKDKQKHAQNIVRQILNEPLEIAKTATRQVTGSEYQEQTTVQKPQTGEQPAFGNQEDPAKKHKRDARHYQAFQNELQEIRRIQQQREQERHQLRMQEEQQKQAKAAEAKKKDEGLIEPVARKARGMLGGMGIKRKQTQVETQKTPSN